MDGQSYNPLQPLHLFLPLTSSKGLDNSNVGSDKTFLTTTATVRLKTLHTTTILLPVPATHLIEKVPDPLGNHEDNHKGQTKGDVPNTLHQDDCQTDCHAHHTTQHGTSTHQCILPFIQPSL